MSEKKVRVLLAKGGLDAHDTGVKVVASALRDAGMEVIYLGLRQLPESIVEAAIQEDVDIIGISSLSGSLIPMARRLMGLVREKNLNIPVIYGGTILKSDREELL
ncbi:MAG: methylmalonyl-CoA mutase, partial [Dehalococcoidia bacterium]